MDEMKMDREMQEMLHQCAQELEAPEKLKTRIDFAVRSGAMPRKVRRPFAKRLAAVALVAAVAVTGAVAANGIAAYTFGSSRSNERMSYTETQAELTDGAKMPETFANGFAFDRGVHEYGGEKDEDGNTLREWTNIDADYQRDGVTLHLSIGAAKDDGTTADANHYDETRTIDGVTVQYSTYDYKAVPADYQPIAEEQAAIDAGDLQIGYGANEITVQAYQFLRWQQDGVSYTLSGFDLGMTADELFDMAQEMIAS
ncbi:hypothetical protein [Agathobaculum sp. Marseille-P7918]|uniref:hypothetical protein n=1 Tax=Agathobaculum sp. Marseille-P7918 TaxID=2479843 RepID=UPI000F643A3D|nr:hypothetical protein [Agathobaculum sp. Marseille-P7918]